MPLTQASTMEAIEWVHQAKGTATLAHPSVSELREEDIEELSGHGLDGIEAHHPEHSWTERTRWKALAHRLQLVCVGGSDFHGKHANRALGCMQTSEAEFLALKRRCPPLL